MTSSIICHKAWAAEEGARSFWTGVVTAGQVPDPVLKAAIVYLWSVTPRPFWDDPLLGNRSMILCRVVFLSEMQSAEEA